MEVSSLSESANNLTKKPILDSNSNSLPITSRAGKLVLAEQESDKCNHFSIRDYVSAIRKQNAKMCLPFPMLDQSSGDQVKLLPPLQVKRFRRWDCQKCVPEIVIPEIVIPNGANMISQSDHLSKNHDTLLDGDATKEAAKSFARSEQQIESSVLIKEGTRLSNIFHHRSENDENGTSKPNAETFETRGKGGTNTSRADSSGIALLSEDNPKILSSKWDKTALVHPNEISDKDEDQGLSKIGKRNELGNVVEIPKNGALPSSSDHMSLPYSKNFDGCSDEESDTSIHFIDARKPGVPVEKSHPRRACKIRTIDDIMKSAALRKVDRNCISSENTGASGRGSIQVPDAPKDNDEQSNHKGHLIQEKELASIKRKNKEAIQNDGEGTCLIRWQKNAPKKTRLHKGEFEAQDINTAASTSKCASSKVVDLNLEYSARGEKKKEIIREIKRNMMPGVEVVKSSCTPQKESIVQKGRTIVEVLQSKAPDTRSPGIIMSEKDLHRKIETIEINHKKALLGNKKNKRSLVEHGAFSQTRCFKGSLREVKKKQRTMPTPEQEAGDDIPMDIVEHLAKKQHEKYLMNAKEDGSNLGKLPEAIENVKDLNGYDNAGYDARISTINNDEAESRSKSKQYHCFDLNQEAPACSSTELQLPSSYIGLSMSGAQLSIIDSNRNYFPQNLSAVGTKSLPFPSGCMNQTVSPQNLFNGYPSHINVQNLSSSFAYPSPESRNRCFSNVMVPGDLYFSETMPASNFLRIVNQSSHPSKFLWSELENNQGGSKCKPFRPLPRFGILGPLLQKEITDTSNTIRPTLGFYSTSFTAGNPIPLTSLKAKTSILQNESSSRNGAFQPLKSSYKMEECVVNRNPADFAMVDEDSEYMIGYKELETEDRLTQSGKLRSQSHIRGQKGQKMRRLSEIKRSRKSNKASSKGKG